MHFPYLACPHFELELFGVIRRDAGLWSCLVWDGSLEVTVVGVVSGHCSLHAAWPSFP